MSKFNFSIKKIMLSILTLTLVLGVAVSADIQSIQAKTDPNETYDLIDTKQEASNDEVTFTKTVTQAVDDQGNDIEGQFDITFATTGATKTITTKERLNVVFALDDSASMYNDNKKSKGKRDLLVQSEQMIKTISDNLLEEFGKTSSSDTEHPGISFQVTTFGNESDSKPWRHDAPVYKNEIIKQLYETDGVQKIYKSELVWNGWRFVYKDVFVRDLIYKKGDQKVDKYGDPLPDIDNSYDDTTNKGNVGDGTYYTQALNTVDNSLSNLVKTDPSKKGKEIVFFLSDGKPSESSDKTNAIKKAKTMKDAGKTIFTVGASVDIDVLKQMASFKKDSSTEKYYYTCKDAEAVKNAAKAIAEAMKEDYYTAKGIVKDTLPEWMEYVDLNNNSEIQVSNNVVTLPLDVDGKNTMESTIRVKVKNIDENGNYLKDGWHETNLTEDNGVSFTYGSNQTLPITDSAKFYWENTYGYQFNLFQLNEETNEKGAEIISDEFAIHRTGKNPQTLNISNPTATIALGIDRTVTINGVGTSDAIPAEVTSDDGVVYEFVRFGTNEVTLKNVTSDTKNYVDIKSVQIDVIYRKKITDQTFTVEYYVDDEENPAKTISSADLGKDFEKVPVGSEFSIADKKINGKNVQDAYLRGFVETSQSDHDIYEINEEKIQVLNLTIDRNANNNVFKVYYKTLENDGLADISIVYRQKEYNTVGDGEFIDSDSYTVAQGGGFDATNLINKNFDSTKHMDKETLVDSLNGYTVYEDLMAGQKIKITITYVYKVGTGKVVANFVDGPKDNEDGEIMKSDSGYIDYFTFNDVDDTDAKHQAYLDAGYVLKEITPESGVVTPTLAAPDQKIVRTYVYNRAGYRIEYYFEDVDGNFYIDNDWTFTSGDVELNNEYQYAVKNAKQKLTDKKVDNTYELAASEPSDFYTVKVTGDSEKDVIKVNYALKRTELKVEYFYTNETGKRVVLSTDIYPNFLNESVIDIADVNYVNIAKHASEYDYIATRVVGDSNATGITLTKDGINTIEVEYALREVEPKPTHYVVHFWEDKVGKSISDENYIGNYVSEDLYKHNQEINASDIDIRRFLNLDPTYMYLSTDKEKLVINVEKTEDNVFHVVYVKQSPSIDKPKEEPKKEEPILGLPSIATGDTTNVMAYAALLLLAAGVVLGTYKFRKNKK